MIVSQPRAGEVRRGALEGVNVYKFKGQIQLVLLAYTFDLKTRNLVLLGSRENNYQELKR